MRKLSPRQAADELGITLQRLSALRRSTLKTNPELQLVVEEDYGYRPNRLNSALNDIYYYRSAIKKILLRRQALCKKIKLKPTKGIRK